MRRNYEDLALDLLDRASEPLNIDDVMAGLTEYCMLKGEPPYSAPGCDT